MEISRIKFDLRGVGTELKERLLAVPIYQRSYAWAGEEVAEFWGDIRAAFGTSTPEYFLGTIVLTKQGIPPRDTIIDGQQRIATICILLAAVRDEYKKRGDEKRAIIIQNNYLSTSDLATAEEISRLNLNSEDAHFFEQRIIAGKTTPEPSRLSHDFILAAHVFFQQQVQKIADDAGPEWVTRLTQFVEFLRMNLKAIILEVPTESDAFLIFETLNDRGADLTIADLLKNYLFGHAGDKLDVVRDGWMQVLGALEIAAENNLFTTFLRHYWSSVHGAVRERELYKSIKEHVATKAQTVAFIAEIQGAATLYSALLNSDNEYWDGLGTTVKENIETLLRLDLEQNRPLLLAALQHFPATEIKKLLRAMISWSVRGLIVGGIGGGTAEKKYCSAAVKIRRGEFKTTGQILAEISSIVPSNEDFKASFSIARVPKSSLARYYLIALENGQRGEREPELVPNANEDQVNLEHVLPERASDRDWGHDFNAEERKNFLHRIGNLALLQKGPNGRIGNKAFEKKRPILKDSGFVLTKEIADVHGWTKDEIITRQNRLADLALRVWPRS